VLPANSPQPSLTFTLTPEPSETPPGETPTPKPTPHGKLIQPENMDRVGELIRSDKISIIKTVWTPDGRWIINVGSKMLYLIDPETMKVDGSPVTLGDIPKAIVVQSDSQGVYVLIGSEIKLISLVERKVIKTLTISSGAESMAFSDAKQMIALGMPDNRVLRIDAETGSVRSPLKSNRGGWSVAFSPDGEWIVGGTSQGALMWAADTGHWEKSFTGHDQRIISLAFSPNGKLIAGGSDNIIYIWDAETGQEKAKIRENIGSVNSLSFSPDSRTLAAGTSDKLVRLFNTANSREVWLLRGHAASLSSVAFSPDGTRLLSSAQEETIIRLWGLP
jgi:WD40 repeat protein